MSEETETKLSDKTVRFMTAMFVVGAVLGISSSVGYVVYLKTSGGWEKSTSLFHAMVLFFGLSFTVPAFSASLRVMYQSLVLGERGLVNSERLIEAADGMTKKASDMGPRLEATLAKAEKVFARIEAKVDDEILDDLRELVRPKDSKPPSIAAGLRAFRPTDVDVSFPKELPLLDIHDNGGHS